MRRRIVIHPGFHKTGTSTIQHTLKRNRPKLKPYMQSVLKGQVRDLLHAARGFSTWRDPFTLDKFAHRFRAVLNRFAPGDGRCLCLSAEELSGHLPGRPGIPDYASAAVLAAEMSRIIDTDLPDTGLDFFCSTRSEGWLRSAYWEHVKASSMTLGWDEFASRFPNAADLEAAVSNIAAAQPHPVHSAALDKAPAPAPDPASALDPALGLVAPLLRLCRVPDPVIAELDPVPPVNTSGDDSVLLALLAANRDYADRDARTAAKQAILKAAQENDRD